MRRFDEPCLRVPHPIEPAQIEQLREAHDVRRPVVARSLDTSESMVERWETGAKKPSGAALERLSHVQKHGLQHLA